MAHPAPAVILNSVQSGETFTERRVRKFAPPPAAGVHAVRKARGSSSTSGSKGVSARVSRLRPAKKDQYARIVIPANLGIDRSLVPPPEHDQGPKSRDVFGNAYEWEVLAITSD
jgi:hypothetical protein